MRSSGFTAIKLANIFGGLGYLSVIMQWMWTVAILLPPILNNPSVKEFILPSQNSSTPVILPQFEGGSIIIIAAAIIFTVLILGISVILLVRLPFKLVEVSKKTVDATIDTALPIVTHHKKMTQKQQKLVSVRLRLFVKLFVVVIPVLLLVPALYMSVPLSTVLIFFIAGICGVCSLIWFSLQYFVLWLTTKHYHTLI